MYEDAELLGARQRARVVPRRAVWAELHPASKVVVRDGDMVRVPVCIVIVKLLDRLVEGRRTCWSSVRV